MHRSESLFGAYFLTSEKVAQIFTLLLLLQLLSIPAQAFWIQEHPRYVQLDKKARLPFIFNNLKKNLTSHIIFACGIIPFVYLYFFVLFNYSVGFGNYIMFSILCLSYSVVGNIPNILMNSGANGAKYEIMLNVIGLIILYFVWTHLSDLDSILIAIAIVNLHVLLLFCRLILIKFFA
jgi:hypothetical protein